MKVFRRFVRLLKPQLTLQDLDVEEITHEQMLQASLYIEAKSLVSDLREDLARDAKLMLNTILHAQNGKSATEMADILEEMELVALWKSVQILRGLAGDPTEVPPLIVVEHPDFGRVTHILPE